MDGNFFFFSSSKDMKDHGEVGSSWTFFSATFSQYER